MDNLNDGVYRLFKRGSQWLKSPMWDACWMFSGFWLLIVVVVLQGSVTIKPVYLVFVFGVWLAHRFMTTYLVFSLPVFRRLIYKEKIRFFCAPLLTVVATFSFLFMPESVIGISALARLMLLWTVDYFLNLYHFSVQHYGVTCIYESKSCSSSTKNQKAIGKIFFLILGVFFIMLAEIVQGVFFFEESLKLYITNYSAINVFFPFIKAVCIVVVSLLFLVMIAMQWRLRDVHWIKSAYFLQVTVMIVSAFYLDPFSFLFVWSVQHWLAAVGLGLVMVGNHSAAIDENKRGISTRKKLTAQFSIFFVCMLLLTPLFQVEAMEADLRLVEVWLPAFSQSLENNNMLMLLFSLGLSTAFIHYLMDRSVFRLSHPQTRRITLPLLLGDQPKQQ